MKVLVAGAAGALGKPTTRLLVERGHDVFGLTRSNERAGIITALGATPVFGDVLDADAIDRVIGETRPDAIAQLLNAIPKRGAIRPADLNATNKLRTVGTRNVSTAAIKHGVKRMAVESMIFGYGYGDKGGTPLDEDAPFGEPVSFEKMNPALDALATMESLVLDATERGDIEGVVLRLGLFYGPGVGSTEFMISMLRKRLMYLPGGGKGRLSWIHIEDGAAGVATALENAEPGAIFNVVDDEPASFHDLAQELARALALPGPKNLPESIARIGSSYAVEMSKTNLRASNARLKRELSWKPAYPTIRAGVAAMVGAAVSR